MRLYLALCPPVYCRLELDRYCCCRRGTGEMVRERRTVSGYTVAALNVRSFPSELIDEHLKCVPCSFERFLSTPTYTFQTVGIRGN
ncbi:hypothetical protein R1flu_022837 [Riccia fluitans]|uniref:Secreted protein n=1 Tax=Riccia fluitans TaxID=41844 RepID=A0ABD1XQD4_9MARC